VTGATVQAYYRAALTTLRFVEAQKPTGRRFGVDADASWKAFRGALTTADRIDLLIRDADAQWPGALGARTVFALRAVAEDEPFGAGFAHLDTVDAEDLWRDQLAAPAPSDAAALVAAIAAAWGLRLQAHDVGSVGAAERLLLVGPSAIASTLLAFHGRRDLDWSDQVVVLATPPAHRQLAAAGGALLGSTKRTVLRAATDAGAPLQGHRLISSPDADEADLRRAREHGSS
jgi:hypothetical protein